VVGYDDDGSPATDDGTGAVRHGPILLLLACGLRGAAARLLCGGLLAATLVAQVLTPFPIGVKVCYFLGSI